MLVEIKNWGWQIQPLFKHVINWRCIINSLFHVSRGVNQTNMGFILTKIVTGHIFKTVIFATIYNIVLDTFLFSPGLTPHLLTWPRPFSLQHSGPSDWPNPTGLCAIHLALHHLQSPRSISSDLYSWHNYPSSSKPLHHHHSPSLTQNQNLTLLSQTLPL